MKSTLTLLGKGSARDTFPSVHVHVNGARTQWGTRLVVVEGPTPPELVGKTGSAGVHDWLAILAGERRPTEDGYWRNTEAGTWAMVTNDGAKVSEGIRALSHIVTRDAPLSYATVLYCGDGELAATDGFRLSTFKVPCDIGVRPFCIPQQALSIMSKVLRKSGSIQISSDESMLKVCSGDWTIMVRLSAVKYPQYQAVIPKPETMKPAAPEALAKCMALADARRKTDWIKSGLFAELDTEHGTVYLNPRFVVELEGFESVSYGADDEQPIMARRGAQTYLIVPVKKPEATNKGA